MMVPSRGSLPSGLRITSYNVCYTKLLRIPLRVGSDSALLLGMAHVIAREGLIDRGFIADRTKESERFLEHVKKFTPEWVV